MQEENFLLHLLLVILVLIFHALLDESDIKWLLVQIAGMNYEVQEKLTLHF